MTLIEAHAVLEKHGLTKNIPTGHSDFIKGVAAELERRSVPEIAALTLNDGDVLVLKSDEIPSQAEVRDFAAHVRAETGKKVIFLSLVSDADIKVAFNAAELKDGDVVALHSPDVDESTVASLKKSLTRFTAAKFIVMAGDSAAVEVKP